jgi:nucleoside-diphosphate-sugar epimerase
LWYPIKTQKNIAVVEKMKKILVYGANGQLGINHYIIKGRNVLKHFKNNNFNVINVDISRNEEAFANVVLPKDSFLNQSKYVINELKSILEEEKLEAVLNVSGININILNVRWICHGKFRKYKLF